jgi:hypothetical protein
VHLRADVQCDGRGDILVPMLSTKQSACVAVSPLQSNRTMDARLGSATGICVVCVALVGCNQASQRPVTRELVSGSYTFVSNDPETRATDHNFDRLTLRSDGTYDLTSGGTTKAASETHGLWRLSLDAPSGVVDVILDHAGYPVETRKSEVRLLIDLDTGVWWVKPR